MGSCGSCGKKREYTLVNQEDLNSSRQLHPPKAEYQSMDKSTVVQIDQKASHIGKFSVIHDLKGKNKNSATYYANKEKFYDLLKSQLKLSFRPQIDAIIRFALDNPVKLREIVLKSEIPASMKWSLWPLLLHDSRYQNISEEQFSVLIRAENAVVEDIVSKDVPRTFHHKEFFSSEIEHIKVGREMLYKLCKAVGVYFKNIGYTQGFNFLAAFLIECSGANELQTLNFVLSFLTNERFLFIGAFDDHFPLVYFLNSLLHRKLRETHSSIEKALVTHSVPDELWAHKWFMSALTGYFPNYFCSKLMEYILCIDIFAIVSVVIAILDKIKDQISHKSADMISISEAINRCGENPLIIDDVEGVFLEARKYNLSKKYIGSALSQHLASGHPSLPRFKRYAEIIESYCKDSLDHEEINITVFEFQPLNQKTPQYNIDFEKMIEKNAVHEIQVFRPPENYDSENSADLDEGVSPIQMREIVPNMHKEKRKNL